MALGAYEDAIGGSEVLLLFCSIPVNSTQRVKSVEEVGKHHQESMVSFLKSERISAIEDLRV